VAPVDSPHFKLTYSQIEGVYNNKLEYTPSVIEFIKLVKENVTHVFDRHTKYTKKQYLLSAKVAASICN